MATADEILATMAEEAAATDQMAEVCTIDRCTRAVTIPEALRIVGVETDKDVTRRHFKVLCSYRGTNLSTFRIRIHFMNANKEKDIYYVTDAAQDGEYLTFSWVISRNATKYKGRLQFIACMVCDGGTDEEREWNSTLGEFTVLEGLEVELTDGEEEQARDAITQLLAIIDARESEAVEAVSAQGATQVAAVRAAGAQQEASIAAKGAATLETIPDDYATLHNNVAALSKDIARETAPPIIPAATGEVVSVSDSADRPLAGLRLYGKTTQDGTPTPDAPVPLVNVGAGGSIEMHARGKNLWSLGDIVATYYTAPVTEAFRSLAPNEQYTLSWKYSSNGTADAQNVIIVYTGAGSINIANGMPFTITEAQLRTLQSAYAYFGSDMTSGSMTFIMLNEGPDAIAYEPYKDGGSLTASTPNGLPGIKVSSGGNYTDANGQQWVCDYKDYERGVYVRRIEKKVVTAAEVISLPYNYANVVYYAIAKQDDNANKGVANPQQGLCDRFAMGTVGTWDSAAGINLMLTNADFIYDWFGFAPGTTLDTARSVMAGMTVMYILANPVETPIPADELAAYRAMTSQHPTTTVYNDAGAGMAVDYIADTKNYIDGKLAAIAAATL